MNATKTIKEAFSELPYMADGWFDVAERLLDMNLEQERRHRKGESTPKQFSAKTAAKLFVCQHLLDGLAEPNKWTANDIITIRTEVLYAQAYASKFAETLKAWSEKWREAIKAIDYAQLMRGTK